MLTKYPRHWTVEIEWYSFRVYADNHMPRPKTNESNYRAARSCSTLLESADPRRRSAGRRRLRSSSSQLLQVPPFRRSIEGRRSFPVAASVLWNSLPLDIQSSPSLPIFRQQLKTFLFRKSFPHILLWHFCSHSTRFHGLCNSFTIWATLKIAIDIDIDNCTEFCWSKVLMSAYPCWRQLAHFN